MSLFLFIAAMRSGVGQPAMLAALGVFLVFLLFGVSGWLSAPFLNTIAGYISLLTGLAAFWATWNACAEMGRVEGGQRGLIPARQSGLCGASGCWRRGLLGAVPRGRGSAPRRFETGRPRGSPLSTRKLVPSRDPP